MEPRTGASHAARLVAMHVSTSKKTVGVENEQPIAVVTTSSRGNAAKLAAHVNVQLHPK